MKLTDFRVLTFDCYGTLIDWESGIHTALQPLLRKAGLTLSRDAVLETFAKHESAQEADTPDMVYSELLATVHGRLAKQWHDRKRAGSPAVRRLGAALAGIPRLGGRAAISQAALQA